MHKTYCNCQAGVLRSHPGQCIQDGIEVVDGFIALGPQVFCVEIGGVHLQAGYIEKTAVLVIEQKVNTLTTQSREFIMSYFFADQGAESGV